MVERMKAAELKSLQAKPKGIKRVKGAKPCFYNGIRFDSKLESRHYSKLLLREKAGEIRNIEIQVPIVLMGHCGPIKTKTGLDMLYVADFVFVDCASGEEIVADAKGFQTDISKIKLAILAAQGIDVVLLK